MGFIKNYAVIKLFNKITSAILLSFILLTILFTSGCIKTLYDVNVTEQRQTNLTEDLAILQPKARVVLPDPLSLDEAIRIGIQNNLDIRISKLMAEIADDTALSDKLKLLPNLDFSSRFSQSSVDSATDEDKIRKKASLTLTWNVLDFGLSYIRARQSAMNTEVRRMDRMRQAQVLASDISTAYWKAVLAGQSLQKIKKIQVEVREYKRKAELLVSEKRLDPIASKAIEKKIVELAITASDLQSEISGAKIELCRLMGVNPMTPFTLKKESFRDYTKKMPDPDTLNPRHLEAISLHNRPEFFAADFDLQIQQDEARAALLSMFPGIEFDVSTQYDSNSYYKNHFWMTWGAGITSSLLSIPSKYVNWKSQKKNTDLVKLQRLLLTAGVIVQAHVALHDYKVKIEQFKLYNDSFLIAEDLLKMSRERHNLGLLSSWALTQRMLEEVVARLSRDHRIINLFNAYNTLLLTLGLDRSRWGESLPDVDENEVPGTIDLKKDLPPEELPEDEYQYYEYDDPEYMQQG